MKVKIKKEGGQYQLVFTPENLDDETELFEFSYETKHCKLFYCCEFEYIKKDVTFIVTKLI